MNRNTCVYVGNIPYDYTEEQVHEIAVSVGPIDDLKLLFDTNSGKSKGYAFVKYSDFETAESAVRNLNNFQLGNRNLKCSFSNENDPFNGGQAAGMETEKLPALPLGVQIFPNQSPPQVISGILSSLDQNTAAQIMNEAKEMSSTNPILMEKLLDKSPQLAHALVETGLLLNLFDRDTIEICINRKKPTIESLVPEQINLLKAVKDLDDSELQPLDKAKQDIMTKLKNEINSGSFGNI